MSESANEMRDMVVEDCHDKMRKAIEHLKDEFGAVRTGRAQPGLVEKLRVDYYGTEVPLQQLAGFSVPEPRMLVISPYDKSRRSRRSRRRSRRSDLGINPNNDGPVIRLVFPQLTEERRKELVKVVKHRAEEGRVAVRNVRRQARHELEALREGRRHLRGRPRPGREGAREAHPRGRGRDRRPADHKEQELLEV